MTRYAVSGADRTAREWAANRLRQRALIAVGWSTIDWTVDPPELDFPYTLSGNELALLASISTAASTATVPMAGVVTSTNAPGHPDLAGHDALGLATQAELDAHTHPGGSHGHVWNETPSGLVNGANVTYALAAAPNPAASLLLYRNGLLMRSGSGNDYTLASATVTFLQGNEPSAGDILLASYTT